MVKKLIVWTHFLTILWFGYYCNGMLVKSWGTSHKINWLRWSINDIFNEALDLMTLGQKGVYPIHGFTKNFSAYAGNVVQFEAYNGWLEDLQFEEVSTPRAELRRVVMTGAEKYLHEKTTSNIKTGENLTGKESHQHEMIICLECMALSFKKLHYAYRAEMNSTEELITDPILLWTAGTLENQPAVSLPISFQMSIMISHIHYNKEDSLNINNSTHSNKKQCIILLEPLQMTTLHKWWPTVATRIGRFNFLADHVGQWLQKNFNNSTLQALRTALDTSVRRVLHTRNVCLEILLKEQDYSSDKI